MADKKISDARIAKEGVVEEIKARIQKAESFVIVDYKGLTVAQDTELRAEFRKNGVEYKVLKNRLVAIALKDLGYSDEFIKHLEGPSAIAFTYEDPAAAARIVLAGTKKFDKLTIKCGMLDGDYLDEKAVKDLAKLPSREVMLSILVGTLQAPISALARAVKAVSEKE
ncbi:MAG: 50S ribosomal protein L10 [Clostridia bacterium]|nr:50S ribosomal protein L10 [Clostridia bacterium]MBR7160498.1 50S ribosomal protein L10 [Clostridia bacterium]